MEKALREEIMGLLGSLKEARSKSVWNEAEAYSRAILNLTKALRALG